MKIEYPIRGETHSIERKAIDILSYNLPNEWILREITERDYGVDLYLEIVGKDKKVTGKLIALQVKGMKKIQFNSSGKYTFSGIKRQTINYWINLPVPVFLVVVCLESKTPYWVNVDQVNREGRFKRESNTSSIVVSKDFNFNKSGLLALNLVYLREKRWPEIESAIEQSLMAYQSFGPFCLICKRQPQKDPCSITIQFLLIQHYENYCLISRYLLFKKPKPFNYWYNKHFEFIDSGKKEISFTFSYGFIIEIIRSFASEYIEALHYVYQLVIKDQSYYFSKKMNYLIMHLKMRPLTFIYEDWLARYYWDEYENETQKIKEKFFDDFVVFDNNSFIDD